MKQLVTAQVNGIDTEMYVELWWSLARALRDELGLTGLKIGCDDGMCGWCNVIVDGKTVRSCLVPVARVKNKPILTIEGLRGEDGELHPLQRAFVEHFATQCGYCIPGMILAAKSLVDGEANYAEEEAKQAISGTLCRCTGYVKMVEAVVAAGQPKETNSPSVDA